MCQAWTNPKGQTTIRSQKSIGKVSEDPQTDSSLLSPQFWWILDFGWTDGRSNNKPSSSFSEFKFIIGNTVRWYKRNKTLFLMENNQLWIGKNNSIFDYFFHSRIAWRFYLLLLFLTRQNLINKMRSCLWLEIHGTRMTQWPCFQFVFLAEDSGKWRSCWYETARSLFGAQLTAQMTPSWYSHMWSGGHVCSKKNKQNANQLQ